MARHLGALALISEKRPVRMSSKAGRKRESLGAQLGEAKRQLRAIQDRMVALLRSTGAIMWSATPDAQIRELDLWCAFTGQSLDEARGYGWLNAVHPDDRPSVARSALTAIAEVEVFEAEFRIRRHDGVYRNFLVRAVPVGDAGGGLREWAGISLDITERVQTEADLLLERDEERAHAQALTETNQHMDEFLAVAAHDLKSPITSSKGYVQLAIRRVRGLAARSAASHGGTLPFDDTKKALERADQSLNRLDRLASRLLDLSRIRSGKFELDFKPADLVEVVHEAIEDQRHATPTRSIHLLTPVGQRMPILADADRIAQAITNLLTNALRYSPADRPVAVRVDAEPGQARVSIRDEGRGIPPSEHETIWRRFEQLTHAEQRRGQETGLGLGLYITRSIVEGHRGQVGVESKPGHGSTFWFTLPLLTQRGGTN